MVPNPSPFREPLRSIRPVRSPPRLGSARYQRSWSHSNADDRSLPTWALSRTRRRVPGSFPVSDPQGGVGIRASGTATSCVLPGSNFACRLGSFFSQFVSDFAQFLGDMKAVDHRLTVGQKLTARLQVSRAHVRMVTAHRGTLFRR